MSSFPDILTKIADRESRPLINVGLTDGNRISLSNWTFEGDCLVEHWPKGSVRYLIPLSQIAVVEVVSDGDQG